LPGEQNFKKLYEEIEELRKYIVIRPYEITNNPQVIARFLPCSNSASCGG